MTSRIERIFHAGLTHRWHTNPHLAGTTDRLDGHQGRVARLALALFPDASRELLIAALTHDDGESVTGDIPATTGKSIDQLFAEKSSRAGIWGAPLKISYRDERRLNFCDKLDAAMWMLHFAPDCADQDFWKEALIWIDVEAEALGVGELL